MPTAGRSIAVARDAAFQFTYEENLELLREAGAEIVFFSPLADEELPHGTAAIIFSGGFPEVYAELLPPTIACTKPIARPIAGADHLCRMRRADVSDRGDRRRRGCGTRWSACCLAARVWRRS